MNSDPKRPEPATQPAVDSHQSDSKSDHLELVQDDFESTDNDSIEQDERGRKKSANRKRYDLYCFQCNRSEYHVHQWRKRWFYPFLLGFSLGLINLWGPFRCVCCGGTRLTRLNSVHPRMIGRSIVGKQTSSNDKRRSKSK